jgi:hypothetical protein
MRGNPSVECQETLNLEHAVQASVRPLAAANQARNIPTSMAAEPCDFPQAEKGSGRGSAC